MLEALLKLITGVLGWPGRVLTTVIAAGPGQLLTADIRCYVREPRQIGNEDTAAIYVVVVLENRESSTQIVRGFETFMLEPFSERYQRDYYRRGARPLKTTRRRLALKLPGHGISEPVTVIALFDRPLPYESGFRARISAVTWDGIGRRWTEFNCPASARPGIPQ